MRCVRVITVVIIIAVIIDASMMHTGVAWRPYMRLMVFACVTVTDQMASGIAPPGARFALSHVLVCDVVPVPPPVMTASALSMVMLNGAAVGWMILMLLCGCDQRCCGYQKNQY
jgi:hypothetical protein